MKRILKTNAQKKNGDSHKNFGLELDDFELLVSKLKNGDESIFEQIFLHHFGSCMAYLKSNFKISHTEAYDITMDTLLDFRVGLINDKYRYGNLRFLFTRMASQRYFKISKKNSKIVSDLIDQNEIPIIDLEDKIEKEENYRILDLALNSMDHKKQSLLTQFYYKGKKLVDISKARNKKHGTIRKTKERSLNDLRCKFFQIKNASI